jgi:hypothetical protein
VTLTAGTAVTTPRRPRAGRPFTISLPVTRSDGKPVADADSSLICSVRVGTARVKERHTLSADRAVMRVAVPKNARGKTLRVTMTIRSGGALLVKKLSFTVR